MKNSGTTSRFEVTLQERLKQQREAKQLAQLPMLGYKQYRVYELSEKAEVQNFVINVQKSRGTQVKALPKGTSAGTLNVVATGIRTGKSVWMQQLYHYIYSDVDAVRKLSTPSSVKWLKPKQATLLRMKGHKVEEI